MPKYSNKCRKFVWDDPEEAKEYEENNRIYRLVYSCRSCSRFHLTSTGQVRQAVRPKNNDVVLPTTKQKEVYETLSQLNKPSIFKRILNIFK